MEDALAFQRYFVVKEKTSVINRILKVFSFDNVYGSKPLIWRYKIAFYSPTGGYLGPGICATLNLGI